MMQKFFKGFVVKVSIAIFLFAAVVLIAAWRFGASGGVDLASVSARVDDAVKEKATTAIRARSVSASNSSYVRVGSIAPEESAMKRIETGFRIIANSKTFADIIKRDRRVKIWGLVDSFGYPSEEDEKWLEADNRNGDFLDVVAEAEEKLGSSFSDETKRQLLQSVRDMWYRFDRLKQLYSQEEISRTEFDEGISRLTGILHQEEDVMLSDKEYQAFNGGISKKDSLALTNPSAYDPTVLLDPTENGLTQTPDLPEEDTEFFADFPGVQRMHPEIQSLDELSPNVSPDSVKAMMTEAKEFRKRQDELQRQERDGAITKEDYIAAIDDLKRNSELRTKEALSEFEREYIFGSD